MRGWRIGRVATFVFLASPGVVTGSSAQAPPFWGDLEPGVYDVGFRSEWMLDTGRRYRTAFDDGATYGRTGAPRPILVNIWYPTPKDPTAARIRHGQYLEILTEDPELTTFATAMRNYNFGVIAGQLAGSGPEDLSGEARTRLDEVLAAPTAARRDSPAATGQFPVVIYHAGHGSSYEDNAVLMELLASHGYVVLGSAFQYGDGSGLGTDTDAGSIADIDALIRFASMLEYSDASRVGLVGHSGGAQIGLRYIARPGSAIDAFVSLDTTQDYYGLSATFWSFPELVLGDRDNVSTPILLAANPHAAFLLADSLSGVDRYYLTIRDLGHNEFISQGLMTSHFEALATSEDLSGSPMAVGAFKGDPEIMARYEGLVTVVLRFLDAQLKDDDAALSSLSAEFGSATLGGSEPHIEHAPAGSTSAPPYSPATSGPPTPRQLRPLIERAGVEETIRILRRWAEAGMEAPVVDEPTFATALLWEYVLADRLEEARSLYRYFSEVHPNIIGEFLRWYDRFTVFGAEETAREWLDIARTLDPEHPEVRARAGIAESRLDVYDTLHTRMERARIGLTSRFGHDNQR